MKSNIWIAIFVVVLTQFFFWAGINQGIAKGQKMAADGIWKYHFVTNTVNKIIITFEPIEK